MGYYKAIIYGNALELYSYEKDIRPIASSKPRAQSRIVLPDLASDSEPTVQREIKKRRDSVQRASMDFRRLVLANLGGSVSPLLLTLTYSANQTDLGIAYKDFSSFGRNMRRQFGDGFRYIAVPEFQRRGAVHFHIIAWGLPSDVYTKERSTRLVASLWGKGFVDVIQTDGHEKISSYLTKYMAKSYSDKRLLYKKAYRCSRNIIRPLIEKDLGGTMYLSEMYGIGVDNPPCEDRSFGTQWLGKGRFRLYKIKHKN